MSKMGMAKRKSLQATAEGIVQHLQARNPTIKEWVEWFDYPKEIVVRLRGTDFEAVDFTTSYGQKLLKQLQKLVDVQSLVNQGDNQELKKFVAIKKQMEELEKEYEHLRYYVARIARIAGGSVRLGKYEFIHDTKFVYRYSEDVQKLIRQLNTLKREEERNGTAKQLEPATQFVRVRT
ncbi:MAG: hypothetical protein K1Y36_29950 [Blastocatellia bacterium]|nr:hypothetical protein [Blastocatellia bacterium]